MGLKDFLFGRRPPAQSPDPTPPANVRLELMKAVASSMNIVLGMSFAMMSVEAQRVPTTGRTGDLRARGYLIGLAEGVMNQFQQLCPTHEKHVWAVNGAFIAAYGEHCDPGLMASAARELAARNPAALEGRLLALHDVHVAYSDAPHKVMSGFWLLTHQDEEAIQHNVMMVRHSAGLPPGQW